MSFTGRQQAKYSTLSKDDELSDDESHLPITPGASSSFINPFPRFGNPEPSEYALYAATRPPVTKLSKLLSVDNPPPTNTVQKLVFRLVAIGALASWTTTVVGLLILWTCVDGAELYKWYLGQMPYISDVGAVVSHREYFMTTCALTAFFLTGTVLAERYLRASRVLVEATEERCLWVSVAFVDIALVLVSSTALVLLSCFDAFNFPMYHNIFMQTFLVGVALSGVLQTVEVEHLWHEHPDRADLKDATVLKWIFLSIAGACGASFWVLYEVCDGDATRSTRCYKITTASAVMEWSSALLISCYMFTLVMDIWPAYRHAPVPDPAGAMRDGVQGFVAAPGGSTVVEKNLRSRRSRLQSRSRSRSSSSSSSSSLSRNYYAKR